MTSRIHDAVNFTRRLHYRKIVNGIKLLLSFYLSRMWKTPLISGLPISISIEPTTHCNLRCPQCPSGLRSFTRPTGKIETETFNKIIDHLHDTLCYLNFYFQGEPYLHPQFLKMVAYAEEKGIYTSTSTNAHYLTYSSAEKTVKSGLSRIVISIDGLIQETYEKYRIGGNLEKVLLGLKNLVKAKQDLKSRTPFIIVQFLVMKHNEHEINKVKIQMKKLGADEVKLKTVQVYDFEDGSDFIPQTRRARYIKNKDGSIKIKNKLYNHCWKMWHSSVVTWDGSVVPCCFDKDAKYGFGNIQSESFFNVWKSKSYQDFRKMLLNSRKTIDICQNCTEGTKVWL